MRVVRTATLAGIFGLVATLFTGVGISSTAAPTASAFSPGNIISDANFYDANAMSQAEIQSFLNARGSALATYRSSFASRGAAISDSAKPGHVYCQAISGGQNLLASELIYRVQRACGISARAILVTLQKERGLITKSAAQATSSDFKVAMGYACPDTAPCDVTHYGFGNQIYMASYQFQVYRLPQTGFYFQPGTRFVQYHPNASCGGTNVYIENRATAGLYNYTPYQPNAASLAAYPGEGNSCSSYGNRNFWFFYYNWFGNPTGEDGTAPLLEAVARLGGEAGPLGAILVPENCTVSTPRCEQRHENGTVYWSQNAGAFSVQGEFDTFYRASGGPTGPLGQPVIERMAQAGATGDGLAQMFEGGSIYSGPTGIFSIPILVRDVFWDEDSTRGHLGWPVGAAACTPDGTQCSQDFEGGTIVASNVSSTITTGEVGELYRSMGGADGVLGPARLPLMVQTGGANGDGWVQGFVGGSIYSSDAGAFAIRGEILNQFWRMDSTRGVLGWPTAQQQCSAGGECAQRFEGGMLVSTKSGIAYFVPNDVVDVYLDWGGITGPLGAPRLDYAVQAGAHNGDGWVQGFVGGSIYVSDRGAFAITGDILSRFWSMNSTRGVLGWPVAEQECRGPGECSQEFDGGLLVSSKSRGTYLVPHDILDVYLEWGGPSGALGVPRLDYVVQRGGANGDGWVQGFVGGSIYSSDAGAFAITGELLTKFWSMDSTRGVLGWPVAEQVCTSPSQCTQEFQGGILSRHGIQYEVPGEVGEVYRALGGADGVLGVPRLPLMVQTGGANGDGWVQGFVGGSIYSSDVGTFAITGELLKQFWRMDSTRGVLGWPVAEQVCWGSGQCSQEFQGGLLVTTKARGTYLVPHAILDVYLEWGGPTGELGAPRMEYVVQRGGANGDGWVQGFVNGSIYKGDAGAFAITGKILSKFWGMDSTRGVLGWPIAEQECSAPGQCTQKFQGGILSND